MFSFVELLFTLFLFAGVVYVISCSAEWPAAGQQMACCFLLGVIGGETQLNTPLSLNDSCGRSRRLHSCARLLVA